MTFITSLLSNDMGSFSLLGLVCVSVFEYYRITNLVLHLPAIGIPDDDKLICFRVFLYNGYVSFHQCKKVQINSHLGVVFSINCLLL